MTKTSRGFVDHLEDAVRENPVAAGLVGLGIAWMVLGGKVPGVTDSLSGTGRSLKSGVADTAERLRDAVSNVGAGVTEAAGGMINAASNLVGDAANKAEEVATAGYGALKSRTDRFSESASSTVRSTGEYGRRLGISLRDNLTDSLDRQPLVLGAIGIAIGAGVAAAFPTTQAEQDMMGETAAASTVALQGVVRDVKERAKDVVDVVKREAGKQGLTPAATKDALHGVVEKVKSVASSVTAPSSTNKNVS